MASQPFKRAFVAQVKTRGGWSVIYDRIASGETLAAIAKDYGCSRSWLSRILNEDERRKELLHTAKREGAGAHAEEALRLVDEAPAERDAIAKARLQAEHRRWMAGVYDREQFGEAVPGLNVNVLNVAQLHLEALQHRMVERSEPLGQLLGPTEEPGATEAGDDAWPALEPPPNGKPQPETDAADGDGADGRGA